MCLPYFTHSVLKIFVKGFFSSRISLVHNKLQVYVGDVAFLVELGQVRQSG